MRRILAVCSVALSLSVTPGLAAQGEDSGAAAHAPLYDIYCGTCHGLGGHGAAPDLAGLTKKYGAPLPTARLLDRVMDERRLGGSRICGDRAMRTAPFNEVAERNTVRAVLQYLASVQHAE